MNKQLSNYLSTFENEYLEVMEMNRQLNIKLLKLKFSFENIKEAINLLPTNTFKDETLYYLDNSKVFEVPFKLNHNKKYINGQLPVLNNKEENLNTYNFLNAKRDNEEKQQPNYKEKFFDYKKDFKLPKEPKVKLNNFQSLNPSQLQNQIESPGQKKDIMDIFEELDKNSKIKVKDYISYTSESFESPKREVGNKKSKLKNSSSFI